MERKKTIVVSLVSPVLILFHVSVGSQDEFLLDHPLDQSLEGDILSPRELPPVDGNDAFDPTYAHHIWRSSELKSPVNEHDPHAANKRKPLVEMIQDVSRV